MISLFHCDNRDECIQKKEFSVNQSDFYKKHGGKCQKGSALSYFQSAADWNNRLNNTTSEPSMSSHFRHGSYRAIVTKDDASRLASFTAKRSKGRVSKGSFAARLQSAADRNERYEDEATDITVIMEVSGPFPITKEYAIDLQQATAKRNDGKVRKGSTAALAQSAADRMIQLEIEEKKKIGNFGKRI